MTKRSKPTAKASKALTEETWGNADAREREAIARATNRCMARTERVRVKVERTESGFKTIAAKGGVEETLPIQLADAMGTTSPYFSDAMLNNIATFIASCNNQGITSTDVSAALAVLDGMKPENEVEAMLLVQMYATNESAMRALGMIGKSDWIDNAAMFGNLANKLLRTYTAQIEALAKLRRKGEQTVKVVHVYPGGQAVVADTFNASAGNMGGGVNEKTDEQCHATNAALAVNAALLGHDPQGFGVPIACGEGPEAMPDARRNESRRA